MDQGKSRRVPTPADRDSNKHCNILIIIVNLSVKREGEERSETDSNYVPLCLA